MQELRVQLACARVQLARNVTIYEKCKSWQHRCAWKTRQITPTYPVPKDRSLIDWPRFMRGQSERGGTPKGAVPPQILLNKGSDHRIRIVIFLKVPASHLVGWVGDEITRLFCL